MLLWHPLEALVFNRWDFRLDRRVLRTIRDRSSVRVEGLGTTRRTGVDVAAAERRMLQCQRTEEARWTVA